MDGNLYVVEKIAAARLAELRAARIRAALLEAARAGRPGLNEVLGPLLVRAGQWLVRRGTVMGPNAGVRAAR
jgi:hypothetical protein